MDNKPVHVQRQLSRRLAYFKDNIQDDQETSFDASRYYYNRTEEGTFAPPAGYRDVGLGMNGGAYPSGAATGPPQQQQQQQQQQQRGPFFASQGPGGVVAAPTAAALGGPPHGGGPVLPGGGLTNQVHHDILSMSTFGGGPPASSAALPPGGPTMGATKQQDLAPVGALAPSAQQQQLPPPGSASSQQQQPSLPENARGGPQPLHPSVVGGSARLDPSEFPALGGRHSLRGDDYGGYGLALEDERRRVLGGGHPYVRSTSGVTSSPSQILPGPAAPLAATTTTTQGQGGVSSTTSGGMLMTAPSLSSGPSQMMQMPTASATPTTASQQHHSTFAMQSVDFPALPAAAQVHRRGPDGVLQMGPPKLGDGAPGPSLLSSLQQNSVLQLGGDVVAPAAAVGEPQQHQRKGLVGRPPPSQQQQQQQQKTQQQQQQQRAASSLGGPNAAATRAAVASSTTTTTTALNPHPPPAEAPPPLSAAAAGHPRGGGPNKDDGRPGPLVGANAESESSSSSSSEKRTKYGLLGLLDVIRMTNADLNTLALGSDLTTLGLNLNSSDCLYATFASPWADAPTQREPQFSLPLCYYMQPPPLKTSHLAKFQLETLFYVFYAMPKDVLQAYAAQELYNREWQYHQDLKLWFKRGGSPDDPKVVASGGPGGGKHAVQPTPNQYIYFDIHSWECRLFANNAVSSQGALGTGGGQGQGQGRTTPSQGQQQQQPGPGQHHQQPSAPQQQQQQPTVDGIPPPMIGPGALQGGGLSNGLLPDQHKYNTS